jgi:hypothetical protein
MKNITEYMKRKSWDKDWVLTNKEEIKLFFATLLLHTIVQKPKTGNYFSHNRLLATPIFEMMTQRDSFFFSNSCILLTMSYNGQVPPKSYKVKPVFDHLIHKFSESYIPKDQLSIDESLLLWKGRLGWKMYIPKKRSCFGMESFKLCEAKTGYAWNMLWYTGKDTELKNEVLGIDTSHYSKPSKIVFTLAEKLNRQGYMIGLDNYCSSPELFDMLN